MKKVEFIESRALSQIEGIKLVQLDRSSRDWQHVYCFAGEYYDDLGGRRYKLEDMDDDSVLFVSDQLVDVVAWKN